MRFTCNFDFGGLVGPRVLLRFNDVRTLFVRNFLRIVSPKFRGFTFTAFILMWVSQTGDPGGGDSLASHFARHWKTGTN